MAYATTQHIIDRFGTKRIAHLTGDGDGTTPNTTILTRHIEDVSGFMDPFVRSYERKMGKTTPFDSTNATLRAICVNLVFYSLREADGILTEDELKAQNRYIDMLDKIGGVELDLVDESANTAISLADETWTSPDRLMKREVFYS